MDKYKELLGMIDSHILSQNTKLDIVQLIKMFKHKIVPFPMFISLNICFVCSKEPSQSGTKLAQNFREK